MSCEKQSFIRSELWILAWGGSVQRAKLYNSPADDRIRETALFRESIINFISAELLPQYRAPVSEANHLTNLTLLAQHGNSVDPGILTTAGYKYGTAQKLLNLALKYFWCIGEISEPPHCPVDSIVIGNTRLRGQVAWTQILSEQSYMKVISAIREKADMSALSIANWELQTFNRR